jgi:hypothetical protein
MRMARRADEIFMESPRARKWAGRPYFEGQAV